MSKGNDITSASKCQQCTKEIPDNPENNYGIGYYSGGLMRCWDCCMLRLSK